MRLADDCGRLKLFCRRRHRPLSAAVPAAIPLALAKLATAIAKPAFNTSLAIVAALGSVVASRPRELYPVMPMLHLAGRTVDTAVPEDQRDYYFVAPYHTYGCMFGSGPHNRTDAFASPLSTTAKSRATVSISPAVALTAYCVNRRPSQAQSLLPPPAPPSLCRPSLPSTVRPSACAARSD